MKKKYNSLLEFALLAGDKEKIDLGSLIAEDNKKFGKRKLNRLVKLLIIANTYHENPEWHEEVNTAVKDKLFDMAIKWNFPSNIFNKVVTYNDALEFIKNEGKS